MSDLRAFKGPYEGKNLDHIAFPVGGLGAGMFCLDGTGAFSHFSLQHRPQIFHEPIVFSALTIKNGDGRHVARVLEGPVPSWKPLFPWRRPWNGSGMGAGAHCFGLPRFQSARFQARFPFATVSLFDQTIPLEITLTGWNPFIPGDADASSLPTAAVEYHFKNPTAQPIEGLYSFHMKDFFAEGQPVHALKGGFLLRQEAAPGKAAEECSFAAWLDEPNAKSNLRLFRGGWFDSLTMLWKEVEEGQAMERGPATDGKQSAGASLSLPFQLGPGEERTVRLLLAWHAPYSTQRHGLDHEKERDPNPDPKTGFYRPWYANRFKDIEAVVDYWTKNVLELRNSTEIFTNCFYDSTLPPEVTEAVAANLSILKSPTVLRQFDGKMWAWEGCDDEQGSCHGTCTHVWNYAQALPHLFPALERGLRETEFDFSQDEKGHQNFRSTLPISPADHNFHAAADGQLGGVLKVYRDWRIGGEIEWLRGLWPKLRKSLEYCIQTWDPGRQGALFEPHHNTYDIEFWGADGMCTSIYLAALHAAVVMGRALGEDVTPFNQILANGKNFAVQELFNGEFFIQKIQWKGLRSPDPVEASKRSFNLNYSSEALELLQKEGPKYQYGDGCLSDGVLGEWMAWTAGLEPVLSPEKVERHLLAVHRYNYRPNLSEFPNPQRPGFAFGNEGGLVLCTWPRGAKPSLPFPYSDEVWTGIEYQVASHLITLGHVEAGLEIVRACRRRYAGDVRNPFDEIECGHWYARAMASYALLQALTGARYDAVEKILYLAPRIAGDFRSFLSTATGFGTVGIKDDQPFLEVKIGQIKVDRIDYKKSNL